MFPSVEPLKERIKEKQWDERFTVKTGIPEYSPLRDKHTKSYRRLISTKKQEIESQSRPKKSTYLQRRMQLVQQLYELHKPNAKIIEQYQQLAGKYKLPNFYIYYTLLPLLSPSVSIVEYLFKEKKETKEQASHYHKIATAVRAREECLERLRKTLGELGEEKLEGARAELREEVQHLRMLTENAIDQIKRWRDHLGRIDERAVYYTDAQENYLVKILNDNKFIFSSKLAGALAFAEKNDPFLLVPVKRGEGKEASMFSEIVKLTKEQSHYQKYMEYLASEKAYDLNINAPVRAPVGYKNPIVQKIYKSTQPKQHNQVTIKDGEEEDGYKKMELLKVREERLKKNDQRIKSIKNIYESYGKKDDRPEKHYMSQRKMPQTDNEDRRGLKKRSQSIRVHKVDNSDIEFQSLVKAKMDAEKVEKIRTPIKKMHQSKSVNKLPKTQEKMIQSLRDIQTTLRSKLQVIHQQQKNQAANSSMMSATQQKFTRKNNEEIVRELKAEILGKIEKEAVEKERIKKLKREQEQKSLQEIKAKLKKQMQEKLQQKKKEKMLQRQELQKKLKQQQERLNNQRQLQLQLQLKLSKQKQLRELQKIKREALEREKKFKQELQKQQFLRKDREEAIERERRQKQRLMQQLRKKQLKYQIQDQLRNQLKNNQVGKQRTTDLAEHQLIRSQKQAQLSKQIQQLKMKQGVQMHQLKKQNQLRQRMLKLKREEEELKRKEIEHLMRSVVQQEKEQLEQDAVKQRIQMEERMRSNVKEKMLEEYRNQKEAQVSQIRHEREKQLEEDVYREKIREKIQREMRIDAIQRTKKDMEEREGKKYEIRSKLEQVKNRFDKEVVLDKGKIQEEVKKEMIQKVIFDKQAEKQAAKYDLRQQFQKELMASAVPQIYENKDSFLVKNINYFEGDVHLNSKLNDLKPTNQKPTNESPKKKIQKGQVTPLLDTMTMQQLQVYSKQKQKVNQTKEQKIIEPAKAPYQEEGFQRLAIDKSKKEEEGFEVRIIKMKQPQKKQQKPKERRNSKKKKRKQSSQSQVDSQDQIKHKKNRKKQKKHYYQQEESSDSQVIAKRKKKNKKKKQSSQEQPSSDQYKKSPTKLNNKAQPQQKQFKSEQQRRSKLPSKVAPPKQPANVLQRQGNPVVHFDVQNKINFNQIQAVTIKPQKASTTAQKFKITLQAIPQAEFDQYLQVHLSSVTPVQIAIQISDREQLYRRLIGEVTFCLLVGQFEGRVVGQALAYHDRNRSDLRKFTLIHLATYRDDDLKEFVLSLTNFIFRKDPCDEIQFHYKFNESEAPQQAFSQDFNKWFDKYGSVFQKKIEDTNYERKYLLKRQFNQKCEVVLGGVNKNVFRNLFSVYCGVLMSDTDMLQFKEELVDTLAPQNQICYALMVAEMFRTYLSPDEAEALKTKVREFVKLKEMLILVVSMQKKKLKLDELKLYEYKNLIELNMRLMSQGKDIIRYCKDSGSDLNRIYYAELSHSFNLPFHFQTTSLPVEANNEGDIRQISYFRLSPLPPFKLHIIKSSLYNAEMNILPTENSKYKIFVMHAQEYNEIKQSNNLDLFMYIRLFLKNVKSHNVAVWKYVWFPEMVDKGAWNLREFKSFLNKDFYTHDTINISYRQFLPGALIIEPEHRDLVITPPFIVGVMSMGLEQVSEGSPLYARMIEVNALKTLEIQKS